MTAKKKSVEVEPGESVEAEPVTKTRTRAKEKYAGESPTVIQESAQAEEAGGDSLARNKPKKPNLMRERHEKIVLLAKEFALIGKRLTHRDIVKHFGCSFNTAANLVAHYKSITSGRVAVEAVVSDALLDAIKVEISRNIESCLDAIDEKLELIADAEAALDAAIKLLEKVIRGIK